MARTLPNRLKRSWDAKETNKHSIEIARIKQGKREEQVKLSSANITSLSKIRNLNSDWISLSNYQVTNGVAGFKSAKFSISLTVPNINVPYVRLNMIVSGEGVIIDENYLYIAEFIEVKDRDNDDLKDVTWNIGLASKNSEFFEIKDFQIKLFFTILNPLYISNT